MKDSAGLLVVVNNSAARARRAWPLIRDALAREGVEFETHWMGGGVVVGEHHTAAPEDTEANVRAGLRVGYRTIAVVGGDGTLSAAASGFFERSAALQEGEPPRAVNPDAALAVLPAGTGDDFARGLTGGRREPIEKWVARLVKHCRRMVDEKTAGEKSFAEQTVVEKQADGNEGGTRATDVLWASADGGARRFVCVNAATLGIGAEVASRVAAQGKSVKLLPGEARFTLAAVKAVAAWRNRRVRVRVDEADWEESRTNLLAVCNGPFAGGGMNFAPAARTDDARVDVVTVSRLARRGVVRELARIHRGGHVANPKVRIQTASRVWIESLEDELMIEADGDVRGKTPATFAVMPSALRIVW
jgi:diacylglycerol kinase family enzyme